MVNRASTYTEKFKIRAYEVDVTGRINVLSICNFLQEIAGNHAAVLGVSVDKLFKKKMTWVLSRLHLQIFKYPFWREEIAITTWPSDAYGKFATRDFELFNSKNELFAKATSSWMMIDLTRMKPITMPDFIKNIQLPDRDRAINDKFDKLPQIENIEFEKSFNVRLSDLDINQHVNNVSYIEWAIETIPAPVFKEYYLSQFEISFRAEGKYGDKISSKIQSQNENDQKIFLHSLTKRDSEAELSVARSKWLKK